MFFRIPLETDKTMPTYDLDDLAVSYSRVFDPVYLGFMYPIRDSNSYLLIRSQVFYPLN